MAAEELGGESPLLSSVSSEMSPLPGHRFLLLLPEGRGAAAVTPHQQCQALGNSLSCFLRAVVCTETGPLPRAHLPHRKAILFHRITGTQRLTQLTAHVPLPHQPLEVACTRWPLRLSEHVKAVTSAWFSLF